MTEENGLFRGVGLVYYTQGLKQRHWAFSPFLLRNLLWTELGPPKIRKLKP